MVEYVRGSQLDKWHWCKNCTQYPIYIYQAVSVEPSSDLCEQCKSKEDNRNCQFVEQNKIARASQLES
jgi:hypothetical protein